MTTVKWKHRTMYYCDSKNNDRKYVDTIRMLEFDGSANGIMLQPLCNGKNHTSWIPSQDDPPLCLILKQITVLDIQIQFVLLQHILRPCITS